LQGPVFQVAVVGHNKGAGKFHVVADDHCLFYERRLDEFGLYRLRYNIFTSRYLEDLLLPVDYLEIISVFPPSDVACVQPALLQYFGRCFRVFVVPLHYVRTLDQDFTISRSPHFAAFYRVSDSSGADAPAIKANGDEGRCLSKAIPFINWNARGKKYAYDTGLQGSTSRNNGDKLSAQRVVKFIQNHHSGYGELLPIHKAIRFSGRIELLRHADCPVEKSALRPLERCPRLHDVFEHLFHETWNGSHDVWFYLFNVLSDMLESFGYVNGDSDIKVRIDNHALVCVAGREES